MYNIYVLLTNVITIHGIRDCGPKHFYTLHFGPHVLSSSVGLLQCVQQVWKAIRVMTVIHADYAFVKYGLDVLQQQRLSTAGGLTDVFYLQNSTRMGQFVRLLLVSAPQSAVGLD
jgi:hypothetical protein